MGSQGSLMGSFYFLLKKMTKFQKAIIISIIFLGICILFSALILSFKLNNPNVNSYVNQIDACYKTCLTFTQKMIDLGEITECYQNSCEGICLEECQDNPNPGQYKNAMLELKEKYKIP